jgi:UDP-N-acetylmuramyl pentapeptide phosphotransferase/UDP-N-acetylglucosamine-1-phosphate transferase
VTVVVALAVGLVAVRFLRMVSADLLRSPALARKNYRERMVPTVGGIYLVLTVLLVESVRAVLGALGVGDESGLTQARSEVLFAVVGFAFLGLVDDLAAHGSERGFRGHLGALREGRVTTGLLKLAGGAAIAVVLVATPGFKTGRGLLVDAALIALAANFANLLDRAPGRVIKFGLVGYVPLALVLGVAPIGVAIAPVIGAASGLLGDDLRERLMLGDTGANVIGAVLGLGVVLGASEGWRLAIMLTLLALNITAELVSFSRVIDAVPPLRWFDRLGRVRAPRRPPRRAAPPRARGETRPPGYP